MTLAWAFLPAEVLTFTWPFPALFGAVYVTLLPVVLLSVPPLTCHEKLVEEAIDWPNWSSTAAANCCVAPLRRVTLAGVMLTLLAV